MGQAFRLRGGEEGAHLGKEAGIIKFGEHAPLRFGAGNPESRSFEILAEEPDHVSGVQTLEYV